MPHDAPLLMHLVTRDHARGAERVALELKSELAAHGWRQDVRALFPGSASQGQLPVEVLGRSPLATLRALRRYLGVRRPDVVLAHGGTAAGYASVAGIGLGTPLVWQRILEFPPPVKGRSLRRLPWMWVSGRCAGVVALTQGSASEMGHLGYRGPLTFIPNHRPLPSGAPDARWSEVLSRSGIREGTPVLAFVGHLVEQKNPLAAVRVAEHVLEQVPDAHFVVAGDGPLRGDVEDAVGEGRHQARMHVLGHVDEAAVHVLRSAGVALITSVTESMTGVAVESLMMGCPVVAFDLDGLDVLLRDTGAGVVVDMADEHALATAAVEILTSTERRTAMSTAAMENRERFSTGRVAEQYDSFLRGILGDGTATTSPAADARRPTSARRRTVAHVMPNLGVGGAEQALAVLARHMDPDDWNPIVMTLHPPRRPRQETILPALDRLGVRVIDLQLPGRADRSPRALVLAVRSLRKALIENDVALVDSALFEADLVSRLAVLGRPVRHVTHLVNTTYDPIVGASTRGRGAWRGAVVRLTDGFSGRRTDRFVALTQSVRDSAQQALHIPAGKMRVVPRGVDTDDFPLRPVREASPHRLLTVGRLVPQKNHLRLLRAFSETEHLELTILGEGPLYDELHSEIRRLGLEERVRLATPTRSVSEVHAAHDGLVIPSLWEGQSNALLEAMSSGLPIVASDIPVFREVLADIAIFVDPEDVGDIARGLRTMQSMPFAVRQSMSLALRDRAIAHYSAASVTKHLEAVYGELLSDRLERSWQSRRR